MKWVYSRLILLAANSSGRETPNGGGRVDNNNSNGLLTDQLDNVTGKLSKAALAGLVETRLATDWAAPYSGHKTSNKLSWDIWYTRVAK